MLRIKEAAEYLGVSADTLRRWDRSKKFIARKTPGGHRYYTKNQLDGFLQGDFEHTDKNILKGDSHE